MIGARVSAVCSRLLRPETFERFVAPAVADLQFESATPTFILRNYIGVWRAVQGALWWDGQDAISRLATSDGLWSAIAAAGVPAAYLAASTLFFADLAAGAYELRRSAVLASPRLRVAFMSAVGVILFVVACWITARLIAASRQSGEPPAGRI